MLCVGDTECVKGLTKSVVTSTFFVPPITILSGQFGTRISEPQVFCSKNPYKFLSSNVFCARYRGALQCLKSKLRLTLQRQKIRLGKRERNRPAMPAKLIKKRRCRIQRFLFQIPEAAIPSKVSETTVIITTPVFNYFEGSLYYGMSLRD